VGEDVPPDFLYIIEDMSGSGAEHLATGTLTTPPVFSDTPLKGPTGLRRDFECEGKAVEAPQPLMVEAMCKANWRAQKATNRGGASHLERAATRSLDEEASLGGGRHIARRAWGEN
jgi:hypothetical protein